MKTKLIVFVALLCGAFGQTTNAPVPDLPSIPATTTGIVFRQATREEVERGEANRLVELLKHADPLKIEWCKGWLQLWPADGKDPKFYEIGLRSDGVLVWREPKK